MENIVYFDQNIADRNEEVFIDTHPGWGYRDYNLRFLLLAGGRNVANKIDKKPLDFVRVR
jgi:hypothetical protein